MAAQHLPYLLLLTLICTVSAEFQRTPASVQNITSTSSVLLIDMRDPPTQLTSIGYNVRCEERYGPNPRLVLDIAIDKKDASWGNGTARFSLSGLTPGQVYACQASSRTAFGQGWLESFSFMTRAEESRPDLVGGFKWQHAVGLSAAGVLVILGIMAIINMRSR